MQQHELDTDLLVAGGGMAGVCAAIAAARQGLKVVLCQDRSVLGGNASSEIRMHICGGDCHGSRKGTRESGLIEELRIEDAYRNPERCYPFWDVILYEKVVAEPNITLLLDTVVTGADVQTPEDQSPLPGAGDAAGDGGSSGDIRVKDELGGDGGGSGDEGLFEHRGPRRARIVAATAMRQLTEDQFVIRAKYYADCTGDGRLGSEAGADFRIGRESKSMHDESLAQPKSDRWTLGNSILITSRRTDHPVAFIPPPWARKFDPQQLKVGRGIRSWEYGFWWVEWGGTLDTIKDNCTTIRHELYRIALGLWDYVKNSGNYPDSVNWTLDWIGAIPGKRESRRFLGPHILVQSDLQTARVFDDEAAYGGWAIDLHPPAGIDAVDEPPFTPTHLPHLYGIPLRCYFSRNIENLFMAGRNISATHVAFASTRVMATCAIGGEAVGVAAARCLEEDKTPGELVADPKALERFQQALLAEDLTLLNVRREPDLIHDAALDASSSAGNRPVELIRDGHRRDQLNQKTAELIEPHAWHSTPLSGGEAWIEARFKSPRKISRIELIFDSGFQRQLVLSPGDSNTRRTIRGPQPELVRDYTITLDEGPSIQVAGNYQRRRRHRLEVPTECRKVRVTFSATHGVPEARLFELRIS